VNSPFAMVAIQIAEVKAMKFFSPGESKSKYFEIRKRKEGQDFH
jgi:hypothetical protein